MIVAREQASSLAQGSAQNCQFAEETTLIRETIGNLPSSAKIGAVTFSQKFDACQANGV